jgi:ammonium transporter, Amt family
MLDQGQTGFLLIMAALVLFMTPGLAFFYGGLVKAKSVISMMMMSFGAIALVAVLWVLYGYAIAFANHGDGTAVSGVVGFFSIDWNLIGLGQAFEQAKSSADDFAYPTMAFVGFQATFAIITVALISGAIADRAKFGAWMVFAGVWVTVV